MSQQKRRISQNGLKLFRKSLNSEDSKRLGLDAALKTFLFSRSGEEIFQSFSRVANFSSWSQDSKETPLELLMKESKYIQSFSHRTILNLIKTRWDEYVDYRKTSKSEEIRNKIFITGAGPIGLRTACELALMGCKVTLCEKRTAHDAFNRFNVLHLWEYTADDLLRWGIPRKEIAGDDMQ